MLAVVHDEKDLPAGEVAGDHVDQLDPVARAKSPELRNLGLHQPAILQRRQLDHPHPVRVDLTPRLAHRGRQARLAGTPGTGEGHQPSVVEHRADGRHLRLPPDERGEPGREVDLADVEGVKGLGHLG